MHSAISTAAAAAAATTTTESSEHKLNIDKGHVVQAILSPSLLTKASLYIGSITQREDSFLGGMNLHCIL
jgi:hypothetical protein